MSPRLRVLYVHPAGYFGGASRSLMEMVKAFPPDSVEALAITPRGTVPEFFTQAGMKVLTVRGITQFDNTQYGFYRGRRWLLLLREALYFFPTLWGLLRARRRWDVDLVHVNEITALLPVGMIKRLFRKPVVVHVRSLQNRTNKWRIAFIRDLLRRSADQVVAIDETVSASLPAGLCPQIVHNGFFAGRNTADRTYMADGILRVVMVGNLLEMKGVYEFIAAAGVCRQRGMKVQFILVGHNTRKLSGPVAWLLSRMNFARDVAGDLSARIAKDDLGDIVTLRGFTADIAQVYEECDVLCFPSYLDAVGRPVIEAAFSRVPSIVAIQNPKSDTIVHQETGICIPPRDVNALADAVGHFWHNPSEIKRMGNNAFGLATENFDVHKNARLMLSIYQRLCPEPGVSPPSQG